MANVLISTLYEHAPIMKSITNIGVQRLIVLVDSKPNKRQTEALEHLRETFDSIIDIKSVKVPKLNIYEIAKKVVDLIELQPREDNIYVNVTAGMKTIAFGVLFAAYARPKLVEKIIYNPDPVHGENNVFLPKLSFRLSTSQKQVLEYIEHTQIGEQSYAVVAEEIGISRAMLYKNIEDLRSQEFIADDGKKLHITDAGRISLL